MHRLGGRALFLSVFLHGALALALGLGTARLPRLQLGARLPTSITLVSRLPRPEPVLPKKPEPQSLAKPESKRGSTAAAIRKPPASPGRGAAGGVSSQGPSEPGEAAAAPPGASAPGPAAGVDLFPHSSLCQAVGCAGGNSSGPGRGLGAAIAEDQAQLLAESEVKQGRVAPVWRELERDIKQTFAPAVESASPATRKELVMQQLLRPAPPAPEQSRAGWLARQDLRNRLLAEVQAAQDAYDEPSEGRETEIEVELDAQGQVTAVRVLRASGSRRFDAEAERAVRQALRIRPIRDVTGPVVARWVLRGEVAVNLPRVTPMPESNSGMVSAVTAGIAGTFDETTGKVSVRTPLAKRLQTRVRLVSVRPRSGAPGPGPVDQKSD